MSDRPAPATASASSLPAPGRGLTGAAWSLDDLRARVAATFPNASIDVQSDELTVHVPAESLLDVLTWCRDELHCEMLSDLSGVHWPAGEHVVTRQVSTTGWPSYRVARDEGVIEVLYIVRSVRCNHWLRVAVGVDDREPSLPSATGIYPTANYHEREVYDFFGVVFEGHPDLTRILMPDDWVGHPHRKDYPLGGVDIPYKHDLHIPPPDERDLREVVD